MDAERRGSPGEALEHTLHVELEAVTVQLRALAECVALLTAVVERLAGTAPAEVATEAAERLDEVRWQLGRIW